uniref:Uncharacterized protein n=1 Tax=Anopheles atroparvus TaxID=41427 RepID=A0A182J945_ANOAO
MEGDEEEKALLQWNTVNFAFLFGLSATLLFTTQLRQIFLFATIVIDEIVKVVVVSIIVRIIIIIIIIVLAISSTQLFGASLYFFNFVLVTIIVLLLSRAFIVVIFVLHLFLIIIVILLFGVRSPVVVIIVLTVILIVPIAVIFYGVLRTAIVMIVVIVQRIDRRQYFFVMVIVLPGLVHPTVKELRVSGFGKRRIIVRNALVFHYDQSNQCTQTGQQDEEDDLCTPVPAGAMVTVDVHLHVARIFGGLRRTGGMLLRRMDCRFLHHIFVICQGA